jgi:hypothetical protein
MTKAVCMSCGQLKFGAYTKCSFCGFTPATLLDLTMSEVYSDHYVADNQLETLSARIRSTRKAVEEKQGTIDMDTSIYMLLEKRLADQSFRDMMTLTKKAADGMFRKELNIHLIGTDGYESRIALRGRDLDAEAFDAARSTGDGDLYLSYHYKAGRRQTTAVTKRVWYIIYDKLLLLDRQARSRTAYLAMLDGIYEMLLDNYAEYGSIVPPNADSSLAQPKSRADLIEELVNETTGSQIAIFDQLHKLAHLDSASTQGPITAEIVYFVLSLATHVLLLSRKFKDASSIADEVTLQVLRVNIESGGIGSNISAAVKVYQNRFPFYRDAIPILAQDQFSFGLAVSRKVCGREKRVGGHRALRLGRNNS